MLHRYHGSVARWRLGDWRRYANLVHVRIKDALETSRLRMRWQSASAFIVKLMYVTTVLALDLVVDLDEHLATIIGRLDVHIRRLDVLARRQMQVQVEFLGAIGVLHNIRHVDFDTARATSSATHVIVLATFAILK